MNTTADAATSMAGSPGAPDSTGASDQTGQNISAVIDFYTREEQKLSRSQRLLDSIGDYIGQPAFLAGILVFVAFWIALVSGLRRLGIADLDPAPYHALQGILGLSALLIATVVLIKQNRIARLEQRRADLDLKINLLTEHKAAKLIELMEELRRDLPNVRDRHDPLAATLQHSMNPTHVRAVLEERDTAGGEPEPDDRSGP